MSRRRIIGGTNGLLAALDAGRVCPLSGEPLDPPRVWPTGRKSWYQRARVEREDPSVDRVATKAPKPIRDRPPLADAPPF